jgi:preprotein translocase subunit SecD
MRRGTVVFLLFIVLLGAGAWFVDFGFGRSPSLTIGSYHNDLTVKQGLDLQGGIELVMQAQCPQDKPNCDRSQYMTALINNVQQRVAKGLAVNDAVVREENNFRILIDLPGLTSDQQAINLIGKTGQMNIIDTAGQYVAPNTSVAGQTCTNKCATGQYQIVFTGSQLDSNQINAGLDPQTGQPIVTFAFAGNAKSQFGTYTRNHIGQYLTVTLDNTVIESATIQSEIDTNGQITGLPNIATAQTLATQLKYGALPAPLTVASEQQLAPTLGQQALQLSLRAAIIGLGMVVLFMLIFYRLPGLLADVALLLYALFLFAVIKFLGVTLSLPGIAAVILTIGMAVDANVLIFERVKEELRAGRTMNAAVDIGFKRAWPSIRDSNASTMITCAILYWFGSNFGAEIIVGFAVNLFVGVAISLFTAVVVTRNFLNLLVPTGIATHPALYGLSKAALPVSRYNRPTSRVAATRAASSVIAPSKPVAASEEGEDEEADDNDTEDGGTLERAGNVANGRVPAGSTHSSSTSDEVEE